MAMKVKGNSSHGAVRPASIHVGDLVEIMFGAQKMMGKVVEDRGRIGFKGRNLYRIIVSTGADELMGIELPSDEIHVKRRVPRSRKVSGVSGVRVVGPRKLAAARKAVAARKAAAVKKVAAARKLAAASKRTRK